MNYKFYFEYHIRLYTLMVLAFLSTYGIVGYFKNSKPIVLTVDHALGLTSASFTFIFLGAYMMAKQNPFNK